MTGPTMPCVYQLLDSCVRMTRSGEDGIHRDGARVLDETMDGDIRRIGWPDEFLVQWYRERIANQGFHAILSQSLVQKSR